MKLSGHQYIPTQKETARIGEFKSPRLEGTLYNANGRVGMQVEDTLAVDNDHLDLDPAPGQVSRQENTKDSSRMLTLVQSVDSDGKKKFQGEDNRVVHTQEGTTLNYLSYSGTDPNALSSYGTDHTLFQQSLVYDLNDELTYGSYEKHTFHKNGTITIEQGKVAMGNLYQEE